MCVAHSVPVRGLMSVGVFLCVFKGEWDEEWGHRGGKENYTGKRDLLHR
jgi:hypothetical protein